LPLWRKARRVSSAASRLPGTTSLRFALHGWQRLRQAGGNSRIADESEPLNGGNLHTSELEFDDSAGEASSVSLDGQETTGKRRYSLGGLFKKKKDS
ncbi:MAG: hypothetical protein JMN26_18230, partial [gamma proteobacterium endosymbiont of Lamellibrachia anaximandri]|nr:hypothetical protein [gamma proteobacterium endosymbiont of Lamellibrachia anaximandri]